MVVQDADGTVTLKKIGDRWQTAAGFPANRSKVDGLLDKLAGLKHGLPVGVSADALTRFKVAENDFERRIQLQQGDNTVVDLYLGSGAGARQSHVRPADAEVVYTAAIGSYDAPAKISEWQDKTVLQLDEKTIQSVELATLKLEKVSKDKDTAPVWQAAELPAGQLLNQAAINEGLQPLWNLRFAEVLGQEAKPEYGLEAPVLTLRLTHEAGEREYQFGQLNDSEDYVLKVSDRDDYFRIAGYIVEPLLKKNTVDSWLLAEAPEAAEKAAKETETITGETTETTATQPAELELEVPVAGTGTENTPAESVQE
ncbi:MAG: hypothetical protein CSA79_01990 [Thiothrix nivea]|nr:MAG: hypothetical protein CSA79_01990 [Thiothrix nivea]